MAYDPMFGFNTTQKKTLTSIIPPAAGLATTATAGLVKQAAKQDAAAAADVAALKTQFDALLTKLKDAGLMASA